MASAYTQEELRAIFQSSFSMENWYSFLRSFFHASQLRVTPEKFTGGDATEDGYYLGCIDTDDSYHIGLFHYDVHKGSVANKRVGLRNLVRSFINANYGEYDAALVTFDSGDHWRLSFVCDINGEATASKRYTYVLGDQSNRYNTPVARFIDLQQKDISFANIKDAFSVEALSKDFYNDLFAWYQWALSEEINVTFPNNPDTVADDRENIHIKLIRLITRLLFVWFIKQKKLVPNCLFDVEYLKRILAQFDSVSKTDGCYYNAILQNLFFATLNCAIIDENGSPRRFAEAKSGRDTRNLYRYEEMFTIGRNEILSLFAKVPFLNGGLFECLDKPKDLYIDLDHDILFDGFSRNATRATNGNYKYRAFVPNILFFNDEEKRPGLINLLSRYNFTIEENTTNDAIVSLDPELLGRVFENLLAAYNPETQESARKSTGSFYTPRVIVDYMVDEALKSYLLNAHIDGLNRELVDGIFENTDRACGLNDAQKEAMVNALRRIKVLDPACGSGAFPMGCMLRIVELIESLSVEPVNKYKLKLDIIENCLYGVDIQPIAMLICKLRFFISLICEQENIDFGSPKTNFGINTLPNLETKFVAANSLITADIRRFDTDWTNDAELLRLKEELLAIRNSHFLAKGRTEKRKSQREDADLRHRILTHIVDNATSPNPDKILTWNTELTRLKEEAKQYETEVWVDETRPVEVDLFGVVQNGDTLFRKDINKAKRDSIKASIKAIEQSINKENAKSAIVGFEAAVKQITEWDPYDQNSVSPFFDPEWMFCMKEKFDIVISNPPYISTKGVKDEDKRKYEKEFGFSDDTYNLFTVKGLSLCNEGGSLTYITPKTFWTTQTKRNMRDLILSHTIEYIFDTANPFEAAMVDTCITQVVNLPLSDGHKVRFFDGTENLVSPIVFEPIEQRVYINSQNAVIFKPTELNLRIYELYGQKVKELYEKWWDKIETSKKIAQNHAELEAYRASLKPGDIALLGCLTEGGQGLATANNGKYIAVRRSTKWADNILESRPKKLAEAIKKKKVKVPQMEGFASEKDFLASLSEKEIATLFDKLKETYGRDIFGQGYIYRIIDDSEIANIDELTQDEKENGIDTSKNYYVPYDKGDKDGNRWYLETPFAIAWSKENVQFLKTDPRARYQGYTFFFREGFCWNNVLNPKARLLKVKLKSASVNDVGSMSLMPFIETVPCKYLIGILNSNLIFDYYREFVNCTVNIQMNDLRQIPIIVPTKIELMQFVQLVDNAIYCKQLEIMNPLSVQIGTTSLSEIECQIDAFVNGLYSI